MKCLLVSDLHYNLKQYDWVLKQSSSFDIVIISGDLLDVASIVSPQAQIIVITKYLIRLKENSKLMVCSGNHDLDGRNLAGEKFAKWMSKVSDLGIPADGNNFSVDGLMFTVLPWWDGPVLLEQIEDQIAKDTVKHKDTWIWIYHTPPDNSPISWDGKKYNGDENLIKWINMYSPNIVLSGHSHLSPFKNNGSWVDQIGSTWIFNPGMQIGPFPTHIIFDTNLKMAAWFSIDGAEEVDISKNLARPLAELTQMPDWI